MGYYTSAEPGSNEIVIGNPQLELSDVESYDLRAEYVWGEYGDLVAVSGFYKDIDDPIETIILRDPSDFTRSGGQFRTFFNNPNPASLWGIEVEARKNLGFIPYRFARYFTIGGNFTWIEAEVDRSDTELERAESFFRSCSTSDPLGFFCTRSADGGATGLSRSRRLFGQPEWIANADISFDNPDWGTQVTLAFFAISDVLDAAGGPSFIDSSSIVRGLTLDRYVDSFYTLDLIMRQEWRPAFMRGTLEFSFRIKNLTDTWRGIIYDPDATAGTFYERRFRVGPRLQVRHRLPVLIPSGTTPSRPSGPLRVRRAALP